MKTRGCKNCVYGIFQLTEKGNIKRSKHGTCVYKIPFRSLPACVTTSEYSFAAIWIDMGTKCPCFVSVREEEDI